LTFVQLKPERDVLIRHDDKPIFPAVYGCVREIVPGQLCGIGEYGVLKPATSTAEAHEKAVFLASPRLLSHTEELERNCLHDPAGFN
jgi:hypothetical protein